VRASRFSPWMWRWRRTVQLTWCDCPALAHRDRSLHSLSQGRLSVCVCGETGVNRACVSPHTCLRSRCALLLPFCIPPPKVQGPTPEDSSSSDPEARFGLCAAWSPHFGVATSQRRAIALRVHLVYCICSNTPFLSLLLPSPLPDPMRVVRSRRTSATTGPRHTRRVKLNSSPRPLCLPPLLVPSQFPLPPSLTPLHPCIAAASVF